jgi:ubiquinone/menaquinone biosynthesis C-methylase UbiE
MNDFDEKARQWDENPMHLERTRAVAHEILNRIPLAKSMHALEFGAGTGLLSFFLKDQFAEITLMDTSGEMLNMADAKLTRGDRARIRTLHVDLERADYTGGQFDIIFTQMVMHHIREVETVLERFYRILLPGGYLAIADLFSEDGSFHDPGVEVHHGFDPGALAILLKQIGFKNLTSTECFVIRKETTKGKFKEYPVFLLTAQK